MTQISAESEIARLRAELYARNRQIAALESSEARLLVKLHQAERNQRALEATGGITRGGISDRPYGAG